MLTPMVLLRLVTGVVLIAAGLVGLFIPIMPGVLFIALGLSIGITWHPKGLAVWRRLKAGAYRLVARLFGRRKRAGSGDLKG